MDRRDMNMKNIDCNEDYCNAVAMVDALRDAPEDSEEGQFRNLLQTMIQQYKDHGHQGARES